ncbi:MAG: PA2779 family protein [Gemmatimonadota bacterium]
MTYFGGIVYKSLAISGLLALAALGATAPLSAQATSTVNPADLEASVTSAPTPNRTAVQQFLQNPRVAEQAGRLGVTPAELSARVNAMDEASMGDVAQRTRAANAGLAGGDGTVIISTTAIIIILLILILVLK